MPSPHVIELPEQTPAVQTSSIVQLMPSLHAVPSGCTTSAGHAALPTVLAGAKSSAGHVVLAPSQVSATSHTSLAARQVAPALPAGCWQALLTPLHRSSEQGFPSLVHGVPFDCLASAQAGPLPEQKSS